MRTSKAFHPETSDEANLRADAPIGLAELRDLVETRGEHCVSIYIPTHRGGPDVREDPIRLKNAVAVAAQKLTDAGMRAPDVDHLLARPRELMENVAFWRRQGDGLAVFVTTERCLVHRLPLAIDEPVVVVAKRFHVKPLLPLFTDDERFYVLAISRNSVRLFRATRHRVARVRGEIPETFEEVLGGDFRDKALQFHTGTGERVSAGAARRRAVFHGQGHAGDQHHEKRELAKFLALVDDAVRGEIPDLESPLVLAGVEPTTTIYREVSDHPAIWSDTIDGNVDHLEGEELRDRAWELVAVRLEERRREAADRFHASLGTGLATNDLGQALVAAVDGRVGRVFVARDEERWGEFDPEQRTVAPAEEPRAGCVDLLDELALRTLLQDGSVHAVPAEDVPGRSLVAALYRY